MLYFFFKEMQFHLKTHFRCGIPSTPNLPFMNIEGFCLKKGLNPRINKEFWLFLKSLSDASEWLILKMSKVSLNWTLFITSVFTLSYSLLCLYAFKACTKFSFKCRLKLNEFPFTVFHYFNYFIALHLLQHIS